MGYLSATADVARDIAVHSAPDPKVDPEKQQPG